MGKPETNTANRRNPRLALRLTYWFGVYLIPQIALALFLFGEMNSHSGQRLADYCFALDGVFITFPFALCPIMPPPGYLFYLAHGAFAICATEKRRFWLSMIVLALVMAVNIWSAVSFAAVGGH